MQQLDATLVAPGVMQNAGSSTPEEPCDDQTRTRAADPETTWTGTNAGSFSMDFENDVVFKKDQLGNTKQNADIAQEVEDIAIGHRERIGREILRRVAAGSGWGGGIAAPKDCQSHPDCEDTCTTTGYGFWPDDIEIIWFVSGCFWPGAGADAPYRQDMVPCTPRAQISFKIVSAITVHTICECE